MPFSPSTATSAWISALAGWWRLRHPSFQTFERLAQRQFSPVRRISRPSANEDLPLPLRPTTSVSPGPGCRLRVWRAPTPRKPSTVTERRYAPAAPQVPRHPCPLPWTLPCASWRDAAWTPAWPPRWQPPRPACARAVPRPHTRRGRAAATRRPSGRSHRAALRRSGAGARPSDAEASRAVQTSATRGFSSGEPVDPLGELQVHRRDAARGVGRDAEGHAPVADVDVRVVVH
jgi:hypothetical protein